MQNVSSSNSQGVNVPKLRFPGFVDEWTPQKLCDFTERVTLKNSNNETSMPLTISSKDGLVDQITYFNKTVASKDMSGYYLLKNGEFAYNKSYSVGFDYGSIKRLDKYPMGALSTLYICFKLKKYNSDFIRTYFDSLKWYREIYMISAEGARNHGLLNVPTNDFFQTVHTLPLNETEQGKIASFISFLDSLIQKQTALVENLKLYKRGVINSFFKKKIMVTNNNNQWTKYRLSDVLTERKTYCEKNGTYEHATLSKDGVSGKTERYDRDYLVSSEDKKYKITHYGDICYNPANLKFGVICMNTYGDAIFSPIYVTFEVNNKFCKEFIACLVTRNDFIQRALQFQQGTVYERMAVSVEDFLSLEVEIPPLHIQQKITQIVEKLDKQAIVQINKLESMIALKKVLLQQLFI